MDGKKLKVLGLIAGIAGVAISFATSFINDKKQELQIAEAAEKAVEAKISEIKGA